jgi:iron complex outermembrane receptor protein
MTQPINGDGGNLKGYELALNLPFSMASEYLDGFGVMVNTSNTKSASNCRCPASATQRRAHDPAARPVAQGQQPAPVLREVRLPGGCRRAQAVDFLGQVSDFQDNSQLTFIKGETIVDLQASYEFQSGWLKGLSGVCPGEELEQRAVPGVHHSSDSVTNR